MGKGKDVTTGYWYSMGMHMVLCHGPVDAIQEIRAGDRSVWSGNSVANESILINAPDAFGGEKKEGGINGYVDLCFGEATQASNAYLAKHLTAPIPAFRGVAALIIKGANLTANNPYIKPWAIKVKRITKGWYGGVAWYSAKAAIGPDGDMNPAHIIYQCITDPNWGMGYPDTAIDAASFTAAADTLYAEGFGLSFLYNNQSKIGDFIQQVINHIGGLLYTDPSSGKFAIKLIRDDYNPAILPVFNTSNTVDLVEFQRATWGETVNQVIVIYADRTTGKATSITAENLAAITSQGAVVAQTTQYAGIHDAALAARVAMRDLRSTSSPLSKIKIQVNRQAWNLIPGDVFTFTWPAHGLAGVIYRVLQISGGTIDAGMIQVEAVEDVFGLPASSYAAQVPTSWIDPSTIPAPCPVKTLREATYWDIVRTVAPADLAYYTDAASFLVTLGERPSGDARDYSIRSHGAGGSFTEVGRGNFTPTATIDNGMVTENSSATVSYSNGVNLDLVQVGTYAMIDEELMAVTAIDTTAMTVSFDRGVLDTVPVQHAAGARIWFYDGAFKGKDPTEYVSGEVVYAKLLPLTGKGQLAEANDTAATITMAGRWSKPYPPGNFAINASSFPAVLDGATFTASWAHRDRTQQTASLINQTFGNIGPETGTTYTVTFKDQNGAVLQSHTGLTGTSDTYTPAAGLFAYKIRVTVTAVHSGYYSFQSQDWTFDRAGYGLNYGLYYGMGN